MAYLSGIGDSLLCIEFHTLYLALSTTNIAIYGAAIVPAVWLIHSEELNCTKTTTCNKLQKP